MCTNFPECCKSCAGYIEGECAIPLNISMADYLMLVARVEQLGQLLTQK